jgi:hypothetical protein
MAPSLKNLPLSSAANDLGMLGTTLQQDLEESEDEKRKRLQKMQNSPAQFGAQGFGSAAGGAAMTLFGAMR